MTMELSGSGRKFEVEAGAETEARTGARGAYGPQDDPGIKDPRSAGLDTCAPVSPGHGLGDWAVEDLREQLAAAEHLSRLRADWIHDMLSAVNPLAGALQAIRNRTDSLPLKCKDSVLEAVADAESGLRFLREVQADMRRLILGVPRPLGPVSLADMAAGAARLVSRCWDSRIQVVRDISPELWVDAEPNKLLRVLVNLFNNAADALAAKTFAEEPPTIWLVGTALTGRTALIVRDNGPGIVPEIQGRIFDRFFSTKPEGVGSGLGLYICRAFMQSWGGSISVRSEPGRFCEFLLEFPDGGLRGSDSHFDRRPAGG